MSRNKSKVTRILYLYDFKGWAIYNVGKLWLSDIPNIELTLLEVKKFKKSDLYNYDFIWFGYSDLFLYHYSRFYINNRNLNKCIVSIHDPKELFPQQERWKDCKINLKKWWHIPSLHRWTIVQIVRKVKYVVTTSKEMQLKLQENSIESYLIPTTSSLPYRNSNELRTEKCNILSVFEIYPRKNIPLMNSLQNYCCTILHITFDTKIGKKVLSTRQYIKLIEDHEIYICTSYQEGGPIPAMDAMQRGSIVLSTPVGQIQDIIKNGENGFICKTKDEFIDKITLLANDLKLLHKMRIKSLEYINKNRNSNTIKTSVLQFINTILLSNKKYRYNKQADILNFIHYLPLLFLLSFTSKWQLLFIRLTHNHTTKR